MSSAGFVQRLADGSRHVIGKIRTTVGRSDADIVIPLAAISRQHASIERAPHGYVMRDLGSRNGTFVNGDRIDGSGRPLRNGDEIVLAGVEVLRFVDPQGTPLAPAVGRPNGVWIDPDSQCVWVDSQPLEPPLSARQHALLRLLDSHANTIVTRSRVVEVVWSDVAADGVSADSVDSLVKRLQSRLRALQLDDDYVEVHRGRGIRLRRP